MEISNVTSHFVIDSNRNHNDATSHFVTDRKGNPNDVILLQIGKEIQMM